MTPRIARYPGMWIAVAITVLLAALVYGAAIWRIATRALQPWLFALVALQLPMSIVAFDWVRTPLDIALKPMLAGQAYAPWVRLLYAPLTEEPAKLWPLLLPVFARRVDRESALPVALALGLGFGIGEIALVARFVSADASLAALPWYGLTGFISERFFVCLLHGWFSAATVFAWRRWRIGWAPGLLLSMALHLCANAPILLAQLGYFGANEIVRQTLLGLWVPGLWLFALILLARARAGGGPVGAALFGYADCPTCGAHYPRPLFAVNLGAKRFERCPNCRKWHTV